MKKISFTISERVKGLIPILNEFKGNLDTLSAIMDDVKNYNSKLNPLCKEDLKTYLNKYNLL